MERFALVPSNMADSLVLAAFTSLLIVITVYELFWRRGPDNQATGTPPCRACLMHLLELPPDDDSMQPDAEPEQVSESPPTQEVTPDVLSTTSQDTAAAITPDVYSTVPAACDPAPPAPVQPSSDPALQFESLHQPWHAHTSRHCTHNSSMSFMTDSGGFLDVDQAGSARASLAGSLPLYMGSKDSGSHSQKTDTSGFNSGVELAHCYFSADTLGRTSASMCHSSGHSIANLALYSQLMQLPATSAQAGLPQPVPPSVPVPPQPVPNKLPIAAPGQNPMYLMLSDRASSAPAAAVATGHADRGCHGLHPNTDAMRHTVDVLARSHALLRKVRSSQYTSKLLNQRVKMCMKTRTGVGLDGLQDNLGAQMQGALRGIGYLVLDLSVREGCVCFTLDVHRQPRAGCDTSLSAMEDDGAAVLQALLPVLQPLLGRRDASSKPGSVVPLEHGHCYMLLQLGDEVVRVTRDEVGDTWALEPCESTSEDTLVSASSSTGRHWALGPVRQVLPAEWTPVATPAAPTAAHNSALPATTAAAAAPAASYPAAASAQTQPAGSDAEVAQVQLQVWCQVVPSAAGSAQGSVKAPLIRGWEPLPSGQHMDHLWHSLASNRNSGSSSSSPVKPAAAMAPPQWQVLARCQGGYVATTVTHMDTGHNGSVLLQVDLDRAHLDKLQLHHHVGGSPLGVLPLTLELWHGERWISASPVLLQLLPAGTSSYTQPASRLLNGWDVEEEEPRVWWWGARQGTAQAAMQQLGQVSDSLFCVQSQTARGELASDEVDDRWSEAEVSTMVQSHRLFLQDLLAWMDAVRQLALQGNGLCDGGCSPGARHHATVLSRVPVSDEQLTELGAELYQHATTLGMAQIATMVQQQLQSVVGPATVAAARAKHGSSGSGWRAAAGRVWAALCVSAWGSSCEACERLYHARVSRQLAAVQVMSSMAFSGMGLVASSPVGRNTRGMVDLALLPWAFLHFAVCLCHWRDADLPPTGPAGSRPQPTCSWLILWSYAFRWVIKVGMAMRVLPLFGVFCGAPIKVTWLIAHVAMSLGEQMQASALLPAKPFMWVAAIEGLAAGATCIRCNLSAPWAPVVAMLVVAPRLLLDMQLRGLLRVRPPPPHGPPAAFLPVVTATIQIPGKGKVVA